MRFKEKYLLTLVLLLGSFITGQATTIYNTIYNNFRTLSHQELCTYNGNLLCVENKTTAPLLLLDSSLVEGSQYKYTIRMANLNNIAGKTYTVRGYHEKKSYPTTSCGIVFNYIDNKNYYALTMTCENANFRDDQREKRQMTIELFRLCNGKNISIKSTTIEKDVNLYNKLNTLSISVSNNTVDVQVGDKKLNKIFNVDIYGTNEEIGVGCYVGEAARIELERTVLSYDSDKTSQIMTAWTKEKLDAHFASSKNPFEGYWTYLDRDLSDEILRLGGRYTIALVETTKGYDIIYVDGAQVKKSNWKTGMLKGRLTKTIFNDNFNGYWIDATFRPFNEDVYGTFESGVILNMKFPVYNSQIRFSRVLSSGEKSKSDMKKSSLILF